MASISFQHKDIGNLTIDNGVNSADWAYGLNTMSYPTYGGEVVQILSVYIDELTLSGTCTTYAQVEAIYKYFIKYFIQATQGSSQVPNAKNSYNLEPMYIYYSEKQWTFKVYPIRAPGFVYETGMVGPQWQVGCHVIDDSPDLSIITDGIKGAILPNSGIGGVIGGNITSQGTFSLTGNISPSSGNPNTDPFQTFDEGVSAAQTAINNWADFYNSLIPQYMQGNFSSLTGVVGSQPNFGQKNAPNQATVKTPATPKITKPSTQVPYAPQG